MANKIIKTLARAVGIELKKYSLLRRAIDVLAEQQPSPYFIQIGANNGVDHDDFYLAVTEHAMRGIVVEPVADYFEALTQAYIRHPAVRPVRAALHPTARAMTLYRVAPDRVTRSWEHGLASFSRDHLLGHGIAEDAVVPEEVPCLSFAQLVEKVPGGTGIDVISIDTEGFDGEILRMIDFDTVRPRILRFERKHLSDAEQRWIADTLFAHGYRLYPCGGDCIALDPALSVGPVGYLWRKRMGLARPVGSPAIPAREAA